MNERFKICFATITENQEDQPSKLRVVNWCSQVAAAESIVERVQPIIIEFASMLAGSL